MIILLVFTEAKWVPARCAEKVLLSCFCCAGVSCVRYEAWHCNYSEFRHPHQPPTTYCSSPPHLFSNFSMRNISHTLFFVFKIFLYFRKLRWTRGLVQISSRHHRLVHNSDALSWRWIYIYISASKNDSLNTICKLIEGHILHCDGIVFFDFCS